MRIAILCLARGKSGSERVAIGLAKALHEAGQQVVFLGREGMWLAEQSKIHGISFVAVPKGRFREPFSVWKTLIKCRTQVLHCHLTRAVNIGLLMRLLTWKRVVATYHITAGGVEFRALEVLGGTVIAVSEHAASVLRTKGLGRRLVVIKNPVSVPIIQQGAASQVSDRVLCLGRISQEKGHLIIVEALASLPGATLEIVGPVSNEEYLQQIKDAAERFGVADGVKFFSEAEDVVPFIDRCGCLVACAENEAFGLTVIEALARGKPVAAVNEGAYPELLEGFEGAVLCPRNAAGVSAAIHQALTCQDIQSAAAWKGPKLAEQYGWKAAVHQHLVQYAGGSR